MKGSLLFLLGVSLANGADADRTVRPLWEGHRWFELRAAVRTSKAPALYRGLVAAAFNDIAGAERAFRAAIGSGSTGDSPYAACTALFDALFRTGQYRRAAVYARKKWALRPEETPPDSERTLVSLFERLPDLEVVSRKPATVAYTTWRGGQIVAPLTIDGYAARFALDTDLNLSVVTEAEARRLGLEVSRAGIAVTGVTGTSAPGGHTAVAGRVRIGGVELRNVAFLVVPDATGKFMDYPLGERGVLGLPVMLAIQTFRWNRGGRLELGFPPASGRGAANLCFEGTEPLVEATVEGRRLTFLLDTGSSHSAAWPVFAAQFPALLDEAKKGSRELMGLSGAENVDAAILPELRVTVAGMPLVLRPAPVILKNTGGASNWHYGTIGVDLLEQAREVTLDFGAMTLTLR